MRGNITPNVTKCTVDHTAMRDNVTHNVTVCSVGHSTTDVSSNNSLINNNVDFQLLFKLSFGCINIYILVQVSELIGWLLGS